MTLSSADTMIARTTTDGVDYLLFMQAEEGLSAYLVGQANVKSIEQLRGKLLAGDPGDSNLDLIRKKFCEITGSTIPNMTLTSSAARPSVWKHFYKAGWLRRC